jgi:hypothetical protein
MPTKIIGLAITAVLIAAALASVALGAAYGVQIGLSLAAYFAVIVVIALFALSRRSSGRLKIALMAGLIYGFIDAALSNISEGVLLAHDVLSFPSFLMAPFVTAGAGIVLYAIPFVVFWMVVFGVVGALASRNHHSRPED